MSSALPEGSKVKLSVVKGLRAGKNYAIKEGVTYVGRKGDHAVDVDLTEQENPGAAVKVILDGLASPDSSSPWGLLAVLVGLEAARWSGLVAVAIQWHGCWVGWHTVPRVNLLRSLVSDPGPAAGRLPGAPGEAVSRFRDDVQDLSMVLDVVIDGEAERFATPWGSIALSIDEGPGGASPLGD